MCGVDQGFIYVLDVFEDIGLETKMKGISNMAR